MKYFKFDIMALPLRSNWIEEQVLAAIVHSQMKNIIFSCCVCAINQFIILHFILNCVTQKYILHLYTYSRTHTFTQQLIRPIKSRSYPAMLFGTNVFPIALKQRVLNNAICGAHNGKSAH